MTTIKKLICYYLNKNFMLFIFCGGAGTLANLVVSIILSKFVNPTISYLFGYGSSLFFSYYLNAHLIYHENCDIVKFVKFVISYIPNFVLLFSFVCIFINIFLWNKIIVYLLAGILGIPITYIIVRFYAFGKGD